MNRGTATTYTNYPRRKKNKKRILPHLREKKEKLLVKQLRLTWSATTVHLQLCVCVSVSVGGVLAVKVEWKSVGGQ